MLFRFFPLSLVCFIAFCSCKLSAKLQSPKYISPALRPRCFNVDDPSALEILRFTTFLAKLSVKCSHSLEGVAIALVFSSL